MSEESINIFVSNIYSIAAFAAVFLFVFIFLFLLSRFLIYKSKKKIYITTDTDNLKLPGGKLKVVEFKGESEKSKSSGFSLYDLKKDVNILKALFVIGLIFIFTIFFIFLVMLSLYFATNIKGGGSLYLILTIVFLILVVTVYTVKSKIINR